MLFLRSTLTLAGRTSRLEEAPAIDPERVIPEARRRQHRRWLLFGSIGAVLVAGSVVAITLSLTGGRSTASRPSSTPAAEPTAPACRAAQLSATGWWEGATNSMLGRIWLTNAGDRRCSLQGYPVVVLRAQNGASLPVVLQHAQPKLTPDRVSHPAAVVLAPNQSQSASFALQWWNWCKAPPGELTVRLEVPNDSQLSVVPENVGFSGTPGCLSANAPSKILVAPIGTAHR